MIPMLPACMILAAFVLACGVACVLTKRSAIGILMGVELMLNAANINFIALARYEPRFTLEGSMFAIVVIALAAAETAVALAIILNYYNNRGSVDVDEANQLRE
ncbi:MAG: NADH-quinone oxidoreductase subunit NuoK [Gemmataceae bacterium]